MRTMRLGLSLVLVLILCLAGSVMAQQSRGEPAAKPGPPAIIAALGKAKLEQIKKEAPGGIEAPVKSAPGSRLDKLKVDKSYTEPGGKSIYYFRQGVLVSATAKATKPLTKEELMREIKGLKFEKFPPNQVEAAFVRRSATIIQGFMLSNDGKYVEMSTYDYNPQ